MSANQSLGHVSFKMNSLVQNTVALCGYNSCVLDASEFADYSSKEVTSGTVSPLSKIRLLLFKGQVGKLNVNVLGIITFILSVLKAICSPLALLCFYQV